MNTVLSAACDDKWCASLSRALLRHGITIWVDVPIDVVAREIMEDKIQLSASDASQCESSSEVHILLVFVYA